MSIALSESGRSTHPVVAIRAEGADPCLEALGIGRRKEIWFRQADGTILARQDAVHILGLQCECAAAEARSQRLRLRFHPELARDGAHQRSLVSVVLVPARRAVRWPVTIARLLRYQ
jgi:hypothetical protein